MDKIFDYVKWRCDLTFEQEEINEIDLAILSQLIMIPFEKYIKMPCLESDDKITIEDVGKQLHPFKKEIMKMIGLVVPIDSVTLLENVSNTRRFKDLEITNYISDICTQKEIQFTAFSIKINDKIIVVFSGTDDTLVGWKENLNMIHCFPTPAQEEAVKYVEYISSRNNKIIITGHSKGGHLAMHSYIYANSESQNKVIKVYNFDGQGFSEKLNKKQIKQCEKIITYGGDTSIVGYLFNHYEEHYLVSSDSQGLYQHDIFSWEVDINHFKQAKCRNKDSIYIENKIQTMLENMDFSTRERFTDTLYNALVYTKSSTLSELNANKLGLIKSYLRIDKKERKVLEDTLRELLLDKVIFRNVFQMLKDFNVKEKQKVKQIKRK